MAFVLIWLIALLFCLGMGTSGMVPSFGAPFGARQIGRRTAGVLFGVFVAGGALLGSSHVIRTLGKGLLTGGSIDAPAWLAILSAAGCALALGNRLRVPQSTSQVTVFAVAGAGLAGGGVQGKVLLSLVGWWLVLPVLAFVLTFTAGRIVGAPPPGAVVSHARARRWRVIAIVVGCYVAFAIGTNNVPNAVAPLHGLPRAPGLPILCAAAASLFGIGGFLYGESLMRKSGMEIAVYGPRAAVAISIVTASLLLGASQLGVPQSLVQLNILATLGVACAKYGFQASLRRGVIAGIALVWIVAPVLGGGLSYAIARLAERTALWVALPVACAGLLTWNAWPRRVAPTADEREEEGRMREALRKLGYIE